MASAAWGEKLRQTPRGETLLGEGKRDLRLVGELLLAFRNNQRDPLTVPASQDWVNSTEAQQTEFIQER